MNKSTNEFKSHTFYFIKVIYEIKTKYHIQIHLQTYSFKIFTFLSLAKQKKLYIYHRYNVLSVH